MLPKPIILILLNVDGCMHVAGGVVVSSDGGRGVVVGGVGSGVVVAGAHMSGFMTHLQHESKRCLQQTSDPLQRKKSHVQSAEIKLKLSEVHSGASALPLFCFFPEILVTNWTTHLLQYIPAAHGTCQKCFTKHHD